LTPGFGVGDLAPSAPVNLGGGDLQPNTDWSAVVRSTPITIASGNVGASGNFALVSNLPANIEPGKHSITLYGIAINGEQWERKLYFTVGANLRVTYLSTAAPQAAATELAKTGTDVWVPIIIAGVLFGAGGLATVFGRRRPRR
ncbi:MAG: LPXTG cell wall anchor domain-containing protein, partial [Agromyces sp.]